MDIVRPISPEKAAIQNISQLLYNAEVQCHIIHTEAVHKSFEIHNAIGSFYEALGGLNDDLVEKSFAKVGMIDKYTDIRIKNNIEPLPYVQALFAAIEKQRESIKTGYIQQMVDNILETIAHCIYKLVNLQ